MVILVVSGRLQIYLKPFKNEENNRTELLALVAGIITVSTGLAYSQDENVGFLNFFLFLCVVASNVYFMLQWLYMLTKHYKHKYKFIKKVGNCALNFIDYT
jgi:hypothetical protein